MSRSGGGRSGWVRTNGPRRVFGRLDEVVGAGDGPQELLVVGSATGDDRRSSSFGELDGVPADGAAGSGDQHRVTGLEPEQLEELRCGEPVERDRRRVHRVDALGCRGDAPAPTMAYSPCARTCP